MRALIVYESLYGNTHIIANSIAEGLRGKACDVTVVPVNRATAELVQEADLLVVGGPTHLHGMSSNSSRPDGRRRRPQAGQRADPGARGPRPGAARMAAPDRAPARPCRRGVRHAAGRAGGVHWAREQRHRYRLLRNGYRLIVSPESFLVDKRTALVGSEAKRARAWGAALAFAAAAAAGPVGLSTVAGSRPVPRRGTGRERSMS